MAPFLSTFHLILGCVRVGFCPNTLQNLNGACTEEDVEKGSRMSILLSIIDFDFADAAVIFAETTDVLAWTLDSLSEEAEPLELRVF